jgi:hypothetical protein
MSDDEVELDILQEDRLEKKIFANILMARFC